MLISNTSLFNGVKNYLKNNIKKNEKILLLISCGLDSTVLYDLIIKSKYFLKKNIYYLIFDHQRRLEGKYEIKQFIKFYNLSKNNLLVKKLSFKDEIAGFQEKARSSRYKYLYSFSKKKNIKNIFIAHHLDDLNETFFMRKVQQSGTIGLSKIFLKKYDDLKIHRPLNSYYKKQIANYAKREKLIWFEDRSNLELDYTRNKIRDFIYSNKLITKINRQRLLFSSITNIQSLHPNFFKKKQDKIFEIDVQKFNNLTENLKFLVLQAFYYEYRYLFKKQIRDKNIRNFIKILRTNFQNGKERSIFSGKLGVFKKKICINLT